MPKQASVASRKGRGSSASSSGASAAVSRTPSPPSKSGRIASIIDSVRGARRYISMTDVLSNARNGMRFNEHTRRIKAFARRAALIAWIEPTAFLVAAVLTYPLYHKSLVTSWPLLAVIAWVLTHLLTVLFSVAVMLSQIVKSEYKSRQVLTRVNTRHSSSSSSAAADASAADSAVVHEADSVAVPVDAAPNAAADAAAAAEAAAAAAADEEDNSRRGCRSACRSLRPPQVVRWDILGVTLSNWFGKVNSIPLPVIMREPLVRLYARGTGANLDEVRMPLRSFRNLQEFFSRELKPGLRPIAPTALVSPVDARMVVAGPVQGERVEQVKGVTYPLPSFLGEDVWEGIAGKRLYHCVLYLAPGDYHRIHSGADCTVTTLRHFPGTLFPISPIVARLVPNLFALNERVVLAGAWEHGFYSSTAVGAYHVGSMAFNFDKNIRTNRLRRDFRNPNLSFLSNKDLGAYAYDFQYPPGSLAFARGDEMGTFKLGSTIVLVFEVPPEAEFDFLVQPGEKVRMGQALGRVTMPATAAAAAGAGAAVDAAEAEVATVADDE